MNTLREAAQQALEALAAIDKDFKSHGRQHWPEAVKARDAIPALRAALAEPRPIHECYGDCPTNPQTCPNPCNFEGRPRPVQEPYAWMSVGGSIWRHKTREDDVPLYTAPPQRKPLSGLEAERLMEQVIGSLPAARRLIRAVEQAHGIRP